MAGLNFNSFPESLSLKWEQASTLGKNQCIRPCRCDRLKNPYLPRFAGSWQEWCWLLLP